MKYLYSAVLKIKLRYFLRYILALVLVVLALAIDLLFKSYFGRSVFFLPLAATTFAALIGGYGPGVFATAVSVVGIDIALLNPLVFSLNIARPSDLFRMLLFVPSGLLVTWVAGSLRESNENAQRANLDLLAERELREKFIMALSHDLRNPLSSAKLNIELVMRHPEKAARIEKSLQAASAALGRADKMIQELLDANRISTGHPFPVNVEFFDIVPVIHGVLAELEKRLGSRFDLKMDVLSYYGKWDRIGIVRIIENLAVNAFKYGSKETRIAISLVTASPLHHIVLSVHNFGSPIPSGEFSSLFQMFHRAEDQERTNILGWGIGLSLVKGMTEAHGGKVEVRSNESEGTTFTVTLPSMPRNTLIEEIRKRA